VDINPSIQNGIQVNYTPGAGAVSHDLYRDGASVVTGYVSGATYNPGDTTSHNYVVRAINGACWTASNTMAGIDAEAGAPPAEVDPGDTPATAQYWPDKDTPSWHAAADATSYTLYRGVLGDLPDLLTASIDSCMLYSGTGLWATDTADPLTVPGNMFWYLVSATNAAGEGTLGNATAGPRIVNANPTCP
jgi:hypothetical protein